MTKIAKEIVQIFTELSPDGQQTFLMYARIAHTAEGALRRAVTRALRGEEANVEQNVEVR